jgi:hypothetical protein
MRQFNSGWLCDTTWSSLECTSQSQNVCVMWWLHLATTDDRDQCMPTPFLPRASDSTYSSTGQLTYIRLNTRKRLRADRTFSSQREADVYPASLNIHKSSVRVPHSFIMGWHSRVVCYSNVSWALSHLPRTYVHVSLCLVNRANDDIKAHLNVNVETTVVSVIDDPCDDYDMADIESKGCDTACGTEKDSKEFFH